jgi:lysozyme family protein
MRENFDRAFDLTMAFEGGEIVSNDPNDPGGLTKWGLSKKANPDLDIANLTREQAKEIYLNRYWEPAECDPMPYPLDILVFDCAVNCGVGTAKQMVKDAGFDPLRYQLRRIGRYVDLCQKNPKLKTYFFGWVRRVHSLFTKIL